MTSKQDTNKNNIIDLKGNIVKNAEKMEYIAEKISSAEVPARSAIDFTCPTCYNHTKFTFERMVLKSLQFFCSRCGTGWKVGNPMFVSKDKEKEDNK